MRLTLKICLKISLRIMFHLKITLKIIIFIPKLFRVALLSLSVAELPPASAKRLCLAPVPRTPCLVSVPSVRVLCECWRWFCEGRWQTNNSEHQKKLKALKKTVIIVNFSLPKKLKTLARTWNIDNLFISQKVENPS